MLPPPLAFSFTHGEGQTSCNHGVWREEPEVFACLLVVSLQDFTYLFRDSEQRRGRESGRKNPPQTPR